MGEKAGEAALPTSGKDGRAAPGADVSALAGMLEAPETGEGAGSGAAVGSGAGVGGGGALGRGACCGARSL